MPWKSGHRYNPFTRSLLLAVMMLLLSLLLYSGQWMMSGGRNADCPKHWQPIVRVAEQDIGQFHWLPRHFGEFSTIMPGKVERLDYYQNIQREGPFAVQLTSGWIRLKPELSRFTFTPGTLRISALQAAIKPLFSRFRS